jgi:hypothetical protein
MALDPLVLPDPETSASLPGLVKCNPVAYTLHYPAQPLFLVFIVIICCAIAAINIFGMILVGIALGFNVRYWRVRKYESHHGDLCAGKVVCAKPLRIAVFTDMSQQYSPCPVIKVIEQPMMSPAGRRLKVGDRVAAVSIYSGRIGGRRWDDFDPRCVQSLTFSEPQIARAEARIPQDLWDSLEVGLDSGKVDVGAAGLYWLD